jgi:hypothetical protein
LAIALTLCFGEGCPGIRAGLRKAVGLSMTGFGRRLVIS